MKRLSALLTICAMLICLLSACKPTTEANTPASNNNQSQSPSAASPTPAPGKVQTLVVGIDKFDGVFSPFYSMISSDGTVVALTHELLAPIDRQGFLVTDSIAGETRDYEGKSYTYDGLSKIETVSTTGEGNDKRTVYRVTIKDGVKFSDGTAMTADDLIFSYYVLADPAYDGGETFYAANIAGLGSYRNDIEGFEYLAFDAEDFLGNLYLVDPENTDYQAALAWACENYPQTSLFGEWYGAVEDYSVEDWLAMAADYYGVEYSGDATALTVQEAANVYIEAEMNWWVYCDGYDDADAQTARAEMTALWVQQNGKIADKPIANISGIVKTGANTVEITAFGEDDSVINKLARVTVAPMHYYGDKDLYNYDNNQFGFPKGNLTEVKAKSDKPMGAGPYKFVSYADNVVSLEANENYYLGAPTIGRVKLQVVEEESKIQNIINGTIDAAAIAANKNKLDEINKNVGQVTAIMTTAGGYGYIGMNADTMKVKGDVQASKNLRTAFATLISVYKTTGINTYYGEGVGKTIEMPMSSTWFGYNANAEAAYSRDVDGNPIFTANMTQADKEAAAKQAAIGFLKAAGFTFDDASSKFTAAPEGARLDYKILFSGGTGATIDNPSMYVFGSLKTALEEMGFTITYDQKADFAEMRSVLTSKTDGAKTNGYDIWVSTWSNPDKFVNPYQLYNSLDEAGSNYYNLRDIELDALMKGCESGTLEEREKQVQKVYEIIMSYAVDIPIYQRVVCNIYSTQRIDINSMTADTTAYYSWINGIHKLKMK